MNYIYYFLNFDNEIIYIGKTKDIKKRMKQHFFKGHLPKECYDNVYKVEYAQVNDSKCDTEICETILINKYKPIYNTDKKYNQMAISENYKELDLKFKQLFINFYNDTLFVNFNEHKPLYYDNHYSISERCQYAIDNNIGILKYRKSYIYNLVKDIYDNNIWLIDILLKINSSIYKYSKFDYCDFDEPISFSSDYLTDGYISFDISLLEHINIQTKQLLILIHSGFLVRITDDIYAMPIFSHNSLIKINQYFLENISIFG